MNITSTIAPVLAPPYWLSDNDVARLLTPRIAREAVHEALVCHATGCYEQPLKPYLRPQGRSNEREGGRFIAMPAYARAIGFAGIKWIAGFPRNIGHGLPRASGVYVLNSLEHGRPLAIMECGVLSARRTAAVAALCIEHLAPRHGVHVAVLGAGIIASEIIRAIADLRPAAEIAVYDTDQDRAQCLQQVHAPLPVRVATSAESCLRDANVVVSATTAAAPYVPARWLAGNALVVMLSLEDFEPEVLLTADKLIVDDFDQAAREEKLFHRLVRSGAITPERIYSELGRIVRGDVLGREGNERIVVNTMGMAIEDLAVAASLYKIVSQAANQAGASA